MTRVVLTRRRVLGQAACLAAGAATAFVGLDALAQSGIATPRQPLGPFYPDQIPLDHDADLLSVAGRAGRALGQTTEVFGQVRTLDGQALKGAVVEIWQCDNYGRYIHSRDASRGRRDKNFQGFGRTATNEDGLYRFRTIKPVAYTGRTPHIHFLVRSEASERFVTQMYVEGEAQNSRDGLLNRVSDPAERQALIVPLTPSPNLGENALSGRFDIVVT